MTTRPPNEKELAKMKAEDKDFTEAEKAELEQIRNTEWNLNPNQIKQMSEDLILDRPRSLD